MGAIFSIQGLLPPYGALFTMGGGGAFVCIWGPFFTMRVYSLYGGPSHILLILMEAYFELGPS